MHPMMPESVAVAVFAKAPRPGEVKTRLIPRLGTQGAASLQHRLLDRTLQTALAAEVGPVSLWCWPACDDPLFADIHQKFKVSAYNQTGADLGERMWHAFAQLCPQRPTLLIGADCPVLSAEDLRHAARALFDGCDAVLLPAEDGGYVLIALRRAESSLFSGIRWSTESVMQETRDRLKRNSLRWVEPKRLWDVDRPEDLDRLRASGLLGEWFAEQGQ